VQNAQVLIVTVNVQNQYVEETLIRLRTFIYTLSNLHIKIFFIKYL